MATLTVQAPAASGTAITYAAADVAGDKWLSSGNERFVVKNGSGSPVTVTFDAPGTCSFGLAANAAHDLAVSVAAGAEKWFGPFEVSQFKDSSGYVNVSYSAVTTVTVAAVRR